MGQSQQQLDSILEEINRIDPGFSLRQRVETMTAAEIGELVADEETAIIEWFVTGEKLVAFVAYEAKGKSRQEAGGRRQEWEC